MIIRLTVEDNDFGNVMKSFLNNFVINVCFCEKDEKLTYEEKVKEHERTQRLLKYLNANLYEDLNTYTQDELDELENALKTSFQIFVSKKYPNDAEYLSKNLKVEFQNFIADKWENSEAYYYFLHSQKYINQ